MIIFFIKHYVLCFTGAFLRYIIFNIKAFILNKKMSFKYYWNYKEQPDKELLDAIIGFFTLGVILSLIF
jgi:hypothetical protein